MATDYPVNLSFDYPEGKRNRLTVFFRIFLAIPVLIIVGLLLGGNYQSGTKDGGALVVGMGLVVLPVVLMLLFRRKYPRWWYDWNFNLSGFIYRVAAYLYLMTDAYPSTDEEQSVHLAMPYPDALALNRWLPLVKWIMAVPHVIVLCFLEIAAFFVIIIAWFAVLITGSYPRGLFDFVAGVMRWNFRVFCYAVIMITDVYPPFSLEV